MQNPEKTVGGFRLKKEIRLVLAGAGAGVVAKTVVAPLERTKIILQTGGSAGFHKTVQRILLTEGLTGFWRGNYIACLRVIPSKGILFGCNDIFKDLVKKYAASTSKEGTPIKLSPLMASITGALSGMTAAILTYPLDFIRTRVSGNVGINLRYSGIFSTTVLTIREEGIWSLYRGFGPTLVGSIPYEGIKFGSYELLCTHFLPEGLDPKVDFCSKMICGGGAGIIATVLTYPNDTIRRRMQMQGSGGEKRLYKHAIDCYIKLFQREGIRSYYQGLSPTLVRAIPNMGIQFAMFEVFRELLRCKN